MDSIDESKALILALGATALAGLAALLYSSTDVGNAGVVERRKKSGKRVSRRQRDRALDDVKDDNRSAAKTQSTEKKKRKHKGKKRRSHKSRNLAEAARYSTAGTSAKLNELTAATMRKDDGLGGGWATVSHHKSSKSEEKTKDDVNDESDSITKKIVPKKESCQVNLGSSVSQVIGRGGRNIRAIESSTGAKLDINKQTNVVTITAQTAEAVAEAKEAVLSAIEGSSEGKSSAPSDLFKETVDIGDKSGAVIGRGGSMIREIESATGASLDVDKDTDSNSATVTVKARDQGSVDRAVQMVKDILNSPANSYESYTMNLGSRQVCVSIIGKGGSRIRDIEKKSGARLDLDKDTTTLQIRGTKEQIESARALVKDTIEETSSVETLNLTKANVAFVIGKNGTTIRDIRTQSGARLEIVRDSRDSEDVVLELYGSAESVAKAKQMVVDLLAKPAKRSRRPLGAGEVEFELKLGRAVGAVIGKSGVNVRRIQSESGASVDIESESSHCRITGSPDAVKSAREAIEAIVQRVKDEDAKREEVRSEAAAAHLAATGEDLVNAKEVDFTASKVAGESADDDAAKTDAGSAAATATDSTWASNAEGW